MRILQDGFGRVFTYLRLSVTDVCNFRCQYCLPSGFKRTTREEPLTLAEIQNLLAAFASIGFSKVRITGGEPTVRKDVVEIVQAAAATSGINKVALTTNGYRLKEIAPDLKAAGLSAINVSIDSLTDEGFKAITGHKRFQEILDGALDCLSLGIETVKINVVLLKTLNAHEFDNFLRFVRDVPFTVRFIELMETGDNRKFFEGEHVDVISLASGLEAEGWSRVERGPSDGPAIEFIHSDYKGRIGLIAPYAKNFCDTCNRLRISARGALKLCLFGDGEYPLRSLLQSGDQREELVEALECLLGRKKESHFLHDRIVGSTAHLASIGG